MRIEIYIKRSVAKLTEALLIPGSDLTSVSVLAAHEAHDMPVTGYVFEIWICGFIYLYLTF